MRCNNWPAACSRPVAAGPLPPAVLRSPRPIVRAAIWAALLGAVVVLAAVDAAGVGRAWLDPKRRTA